jgi:hypothetical protein
MKMDRTRPGHKLLYVFDPFRSIGPSLPYAEEAIKQYRESQLVDMAVLY